jgi:hypothetical protein
MSVDIKTRAYWIPLLLLVSFAVLGCGSSESGFVSVEGIWVDVAADGSSITVTLIQSGAKVSGTFQAGSGWTGTVSGSVSGDEIGFTYTYSDGYRIYSRARVDGDEMVDGLFWSLDDDRYGTWRATRAAEPVEVTNTVPRVVRRPSEPDPPDPGPAPLLPSGVIEFDTVFIPGGPVVLSDIIEMNMRFVTATGVTHSDIGNPVFPDNGTPFMLLSAGQTPLVISNTLSQAFSLMSVDLSEFSTAFAVPRSIPFVGYKTDGSTVSKTFDLDGVIDGSGPLGDYETFSFGNEFRDVTHVEVQTGLYCMDNLVLGQ